MRFESSINLHNFVDVIHTCYADLNPVSQKTVRTTISIPRSLYEKACERAKELHFAGFSDYLQHLLREDVVFRIEPEPEQKPNKPQSISDNPVLDPNAPVPHPGAPVKKRRRLYKGERGLDPIEEN
jgi:hypothetical protein